MKSFDALQPWRRLSRDRRRILLRIVAVAGGCGAALSPAAPTGLPPVDLAFNGVTGFVLCLAAGNAKRWTLPVMAAGAGAFGAGWWQLAALAALVYALLALYASRRDRVTGGIVAAVALQALFRIPADLHQLGVPTLLAGAACAPALASGWSNRPRAERRRWAWAAAGLLAAAAALTGIAGVTLLGARSDIDLAVDASRDAATALTGNDDEAAAASFGRAEAAFARVERAAGRPWVRAARLVPVAGRHVATVADVAGAGRSLAATGATSVAELDFDRIELRDSAIDLAALDAFRGPATRAVEELTEARQIVADTRSPWLVGPVQDQLDEVEAELDDAIPGAQLALDALDAAPDLLGAERPRRYLVLFTNPAESRELGGFVASLGLLSADRGRIDFAAVDGPTALLGRALREAGATTTALALPAPFEAQQPATFPQNWTGTPDFPTVAEVATTLWNQVRADVPVDGVLVADPFVVARLLELVGPVQIPDTETTVGPRNATEFLLRTQYIDFEVEDQGERKDLLKDVGEIAFERLVSGAGASPPVLADLLSPLARQRRLLFTTVDGAHRDLLARVGLQGELRGPDDDSDVLSVVTSNLRANKLDAYLAQDTRYSATVADDGTIEAEVLVTLTNSAPEGLPDYVAIDNGDVVDDLGAGTARVALAIYTPHALTAAAIDDIDAASATNDAYGILRHSVVAVVPPGRSVQVRFTLRGADALESYRMRYTRTARAVPETFAIDVVDASGDVLLRRKSE